MRWLLLLGLFGGCDLKKFTVDTTAPVLRLASEKFAQEGDLELARQAAPAQLETADGFLASAPRNRVLLDLLARGFLEYAFGFLEDALEALPDDRAHEAERAELTERATNLYDRSFKYALALLGNRDVELSLSKGPAELGAALQRTREKDAPALLYAGMAMASAINLNRGDVERLAALPKARLLVERAHSLQPKIYNGAAPMTLGLMAASRGKALGGDPDLAKRLFDESIAATGGGYLMPRVLYARYYAVQIQDRALYDSTLKAALAATSPAEFRLANALAKRRAKRYLERGDEYF